MGKVLKKIILFLIVSVLGYIAIWIYLKLKAAVNLSSSLPQYLKNIYDEEIEVDVSIAFRSYSVDLLCSADIMDKEDIIKQSVLNYIDDFYPEFNSPFLKVNVTSRIQAD